MISTIKVSEKGFTKTQNLEGNDNIINDDVFVNLAYTLPAFYTEKILKTTKTLSAITSLKAKRIDVRGTVIFLDNNGQPCVLEETNITTPADFITLQSNTNYNWYHTSINEQSDFATDGYYIFEFTDGTNEFETDIVCMNFSEIPFAPFKFTITGSTFTLPTVSGETYNATIDWGDGQSNTITAYNDAGISHTYSVSGTYQISITGTFGGFSFNNGGDKLKLDTIDQWGDIVFTYLQSAFYGCTNLTIISGVLTHSGTSLASLIRNCTSLTSFELTEIDTSTVENFNNFAEGANSLIALSVENLNMQSAKFCNSMFEDCSAITMLDVSGWDVSSLLQASSFVEGCSNLTTLDVSLWETDNITTLNSFARSCTDLTALDVSGWETGSVTDVGNFIRSCTTITTLNVSSWDTTLFNTISSFADGCTALTALDVSGWVTGSISTAVAFIRNCTQISTLDVSLWNTSSLTNINNFVSQATGLITLNTNSWDTTAIQFCARMCDDCTSLTTSFDQYRWWNRTDDNTSGGVPDPIGSFTDCFANATNISNYASIPNNWKGL